MDATEQPFGSYELSLRGEDVDVRFEGGGVAAHRIASELELALGHWDVRQIPHHRALRLDLRLDVGTTGSARVDYAEVRLGSDTYWVASKPDDAVAELSGRHLTVRIGFPPSVGAGSARPKDHPMRHPASLEARLLLPEPLPAKCSVPAEVRSALDEAFSGTIREYASHATEGHDRRCVSVLVGSTAPPDLSALQARVPAGWQASFRSGWTAPDEARTWEVVVGPGRMPGDPVRLAATDALNHGMTTEDIALRLEALQDAMPHQVLGADGQGVLLRLTEPPRDAHAVSRQLWALCPDLAQAGIEDADALAPLLGRAPALLVLWWD